jgi:hypothetical protein
VRRDHGRADLAAAGGSYAGGVVNRDSVLGSVATRLTIFRPRKRLNRSWKAEAGEPSP